MRNPNPSRGRLGDRLFVAACVGAYLALMGAVALALLFYGA